MSFGCTVDNFWLDPNTLRPLVTNLSNGQHPTYTELRIIGGGAYSTVAAAVDSRSGDRVAIKRVDEVFYSLIEAKKVLREIRLMHDFCHPNLMSLREIVQPADLTQFTDLYFVLDYMDADLGDVMRRKGGRLMTGEKVRTYLAMFLRGLEHIHALGGIHRDLKPSNVLISDAGVLRLCDFGMSRTVRLDAGDERQRHRAQTAGLVVDVVEPRESEAELSESSPPMIKSRQLTTHVCTRWYRAPEAVMEEHYDAKLDLWSVGCIFKEMLDSARELEGAHLRRMKRLGPDPMFPGGTSMQSVGRDGTESPEDSFSRDPLRHELHGQLARIFSVLGIPTEEELSWASQPAVRRASDLISRVSHPSRPFSRLSAAERREEVRRLIRNKMKPEVDGEDALDLLGALLSIDPRERPSASAALAHPYLESAAEETYTLPRGVQRAHLAAIEAAFEFEQQELTQEQLREMICSEVERSTCADAPEASCMASLQRVRRLHNMKEPWTLFAPDADARGATSRLLAMVFGCADEWAADGALLDGVVGAPPAAPAAFAPLCAELLVALEKFLVSCILTLRYAKDAAPLLGSAEQFMRTFGEKSRASRSCLSTPGRSPRQSSSSFMHIETKEVAMEIEETPPPAVSSTAPTSPPPTTPTPGPTQRPRRSSVMQTIKGLYRRASSRPSSRPKSRYFSSTPHAKKR
mmetsp:Transcript_25829/g.63896  ORF Transcript_25829/g.63896 Transcript_25829/m.63896 type:complete len:691 (+) Transcript_25829:63-2135(+)